MRQAKINQYSLRKLFRASEDVAVCVLPTCHVVNNICEDKKK